MAPPQTTDYHSRKAAARFDDWAGSYGEDRISGWFQHYQQIALDRLALKHDERFLDIGCGTGWAVREAARTLPGGSACGIDISPAMVNKAKELSCALGNCEFHVANSESLPYEADRFDALMCTFSFHHYHSPRLALSEFRRVLRPGGRMVIVDSARNLSPVIWLQDRWRRHFEPSHVRYYTVSELTDMVREAGFTLPREVETHTGLMSHGKAFTGLAVLVCQ